MFRAIRFLIISMTLGRLKWATRMTWVWRLIVFLGVTGWLARKLRQVIGLDKSSTPKVDSAWAEALRYAPASGAATAGANAAATQPSSPPAAAPPPPAQPSIEDESITESLSEVTGFAADGTAETITMHEVSASGETETVVRIEDDEGNVETFVTGSSVEDLDLSQLGSRSGEPSQSVANDNLGEAEMPPTALIEDVLIDDVIIDDVITDDVSIEEGDHGEIIIDEVITEDTIIAEVTSRSPESDEVEIEIIEDIQVVEIIEVLEAGEPEAAEEIEPDSPKVERPTETEQVAPGQPLESVREDQDADTDIEPDWVRGDGTHDCPLDYPVKAKASSMIYYVPESGHYSLTIPDVCFASDADAQAAGYRAPRRG